MSDGYYKLFKDRKGEWRFNLISPNGKVIAVSEGYSSKRNALNGMIAVRTYADTWDVRIMRGTKHGRRK